MRHDPLTHAAEAVFEALVGFPDGPVAVAVTDPRVENFGAFPAEFEEMPRAEEGRRREYIAGRVAAHRAMEKLGLSARPVLTNRSRAPAWPRGLVGSLSHNATTCVALVARSSEVKSLGVTVGDDTPLGPEKIDTTCTLEERAWLATQPEAARGRLARVIFCAKEAVCKCQYPLSHRKPGFAALLVTPDIDTGQFEATFLADTGRFHAGARLDGRFAVADGLVHVAVVLLPAAAP